MFDQSHIQRYLPRPIPDPEITNPLSTIKAINACVNQINERKIDITSGYERWLKIGFSLASLGESGRDYFHEVSQHYLGYNMRECNKQFDNCLKNYDGKTSISTFFHYCKENDILATSVHTVHNCPHLKNGQLKSQLINNKGVKPKNKGVHMDSKDVVNKIVRIRTANERLNKAKSLEKMSPLFGTLWQTGEIAILAADTGVGKTLLAVGISDAITKGHNYYLGQPINNGGKILYYDFELTDRNFLNRYTNYDFSDGLLFVDYNPSYIGEDTFNIKQIEEDVIKHNSNIVIIDNISALSMRSTAEADESIKIMKELKTLQLNYGISVLVLAHTPKIPDKVPLTLNHLAGSKHLSNFCDSVFFLARSKVDMNYRYIIQKKSRNAPELEECVIIEKVDKEGFIGFEFINYDTEINHLFEKRSPEEELELVRSLQKQGKSYRQIADELGISKSKVSNMLKRL